MKLITIFSIIAIATIVVLIIGLRTVFSLLKKRGKNYTKVEAIETNDKRVTYNRKWFKPVYEYQLHGETKTYKSEVLLRVPLSGKAKTTLYINNDTGEIVNKAHIMKRVLLTIFGAMMTESALTMMFSNAIMRALINS